MTEITIIKHDHAVTVAFPHKIETIAVERDPALEGVPIRLHDAAQRYNMLEQTISKWAERGLLRIIEQRQRLLTLDESDVDLAARLYRELTVYISPQHAGRVLNRVLV